MSSRYRPGTIDDSEFRYFGSSPVCQDCRHRVTFDRLACAAFPDRIPEEIWNGQRDHDTPFPGDGGIQFAPMTAEDHERQRRYVEERNAWYGELRDRLIAEGKLKPKTPVETLTADSALQRAAG